MDTRVPCTSDARPASNSGPIRTPSRMSKVTRLISERPTDDEIAALFRELGRTRSKTVRNRLAGHYAGFAAALARRFARRSDSATDLEQVAQLGLLLALDRFDPDRGVPFEAFAAPTIVGEIKRHFRDKGWSVRVPRRIQELHLRIRAVVAEFSQEHGRSPTPDEIAEQTGRDVDAVLEAMEAGDAYTASSLDAQIGEDTPPDAGRDVRLGEEDARFDHVELRLTVRDLLDELPERERRIVAMRFVDNLTQSEIAARVGVSQMHVSRLLARSLERLRARLET